MLMYNFNHLSGSGENKPTGGTRQPDKSVTISKQSLFSFLINKPFNATFVQVNLE